MTSISGTCSVIDKLILVWEIGIHTVEEVNFQCEKMCFRTSICCVSCFHTCAITSISGACCVIDMGNRHSHCRRGQSEICIFSVRKDVVSLIHLSCISLNTCAMTSISGTCDFIGILILVWEIDIRTI